MILLLKDFCDRYKHNQTSEQRAEIWRYFGYQSKAYPDKYRIGSALAKKWLILYKRCSRCHSIWEGWWSWPPEPHPADMTAYFKMDIPAGTFCFGECRACKYLEYFYHHPLPKRK